MLSELIDFCDAFGRKVSDIDGILVLGQRESLRCDVDSICDLVPEADRMLPRASNDSWWSHEKSVTIRTLPIHSLVYL